MGVEIKPGRQKKLLIVPVALPRIANRLLRRVRDFAQFFGREIIDEEIAKEAFNHLGVDEVGLTDFDRKFLEVLVKHYQGGPVGIENIASALGEDPATLEEGL